MTVLQDTVKTSLSLSPTPSIEDTSLEGIYSSAHTDHEVNPFGDPQFPIQDPTNRWIDSSVTDSQPLGMPDAPSDHANSQFSPLVPTSPDISEESERANASSSTQSSLSPLSSPSPSLLNTEVIEPDLHDGGSLIEGSRRVSKLRNDGSHTMS